MNTRLQNFLDAENLTQSQFADIIKVGKANVSHIIAGRNKPSFEFITSMLEHFPRLNPDWLISGKGKMYRDLQKDYPRNSSIDSAVGDESQNLFAGIDNRPGNENPPAQRQAGPEYAVPEESITDGHLHQTSEKQRVISKIIIFYNDGSYEEIN